VQRPEASLKNLSDLVSNCARALGVKVEITSKRNRGARGGTFLRIENRLCQIVPTRSFVSNPDYPRSRSAFLYLPRNQFPEFLVYVRGDAQEPGKHIFYIVPSGDIKKDTSFVKQTLQKYENAWHLLREILPGGRTKIQHRELSPAIRSILEAASNMQFLAFPVERIDGFRRGTPYYQRQVRVEGKLCRVMTAPRCSDTMDGVGWSTVHLRAPRTEVDEFVIYVVTPSEGDLTNFIIVPRNEVKKNTTRSLYGSWTAQYLDAWHLIKED